MFLVKNVKNSYEYFYCYILFLHIGSSSLLKYAKQNVFKSNSIYLIFCLAHQCNNCIHLSKDKNDHVILIYS